MNRITNLTTNLTMKRLMDRPIKRVFPRLIAVSITAGVLFCASALLARPGILKTKAGQTYNGDIKDDGDTYTVTVDKVATQIAKADVVSLSFSGSIDDDFSQRLANLDPKDAEGRVKLARFAFDKGRNDLAIQALSGAMQIDPNNADAMDMLKTVQLQQTLEHSRSAAAAASETPPDTTPGTTPGTTSGTASGQSTGNGGAIAAAPTTQITKRVLTAADINSIRQHEIMPGEDIPISIPNDLKRKFAAKIGMSFSNFEAMAPLDQLSQILQQGDHDMKAAVKIGRDPEAIMQFKRLIQPMILRNCATSGCHGGAAGGSFILFNGNDQATTYTNFYIMEQFAMKTAASGGFFGSGGDRKLIERGDGAHSVLINFGLPAGQGDISHPKVPNSGFNGIFRSRDDRLYGQTIDWMDKGLNLIAPNYEINYAPPVATTAPASQPATMP